MYRWRVPSLVATALIAGPLVLAPTAHAATIGQVMYLHESTPAPTDSTIDVGWNKVAGAFQYAVEVFQGDTEIGYAYTTATHYEATGLNPGTYYTFQVSAGDNVQGDPFGPPSNKLSIKTTGQACIRVLARPAIQVASTPGQVKNIHQSTPAPTDTTIDVGWNKVTGATFYQVDYTHGNTTFSAQLTGTHYEATGLSPGTSYSFQVEAYNGTNFGPYSDILTITTPGTACN